MFVAMAVFRAMPITRINVSNETNDIHLDICDNLCMAVLLILGSMYEEPVLETANTHYAISKMLLSCF